MLESTSDYWRPWFYLFEARGLTVWLVNANQVKQIPGRPKTDQLTAAIPARLLRADLLPGPGSHRRAVRQLRALVRHRIGLIRLRTSLGNRIHAVLADHGLDRAGGFRSGPGRSWLAGLDLPPVSRMVIEDCLAAIDAVQPIIDRLDLQVAARAKADPAGADPDPAARDRTVHRAGHPRRNRRHQLVPDARGSWPPGPC